MRRKNTKTQRVVFRKFKDGGEIVAFFLDQPEPFGCTSYMHVGQHGGGNYPNTFTVAATPEEYKDLLAELKSIGYDDLRIVKRGRVQR